MGSVGIDAEEREQMVQAQLVQRGISQGRLLAAMRSVPRHEFVPEDQRDQAYADCSLPMRDADRIASFGVRVIQPYFTAMLVELAEIEEDTNVLHVGTGSGYQTAVIAELGAKVRGIEIFEDVARAARTRLGNLGYGWVPIRAADGYYGWPEHAPYDAIVVAASAAGIPKPLFDQLKIGGRLAGPVYTRRPLCEFEVITRTERGPERHRAPGSSFEEMIGEARRPGASYV